MKNNGLTGTDIKAATVAGTSRALVYDSGATTSLTTLATVKLGGDKFVFKGTCPGVSAQRGRPGRQRRGRLGSARRHDLDRLRTAE